MSRKSNFKHRLTEMFIFSKSERRGILWLLPLLAVVGLIVIFANRPGFEKSFIQQITEDATGGAASGVQDGAQVGAQDGAQVGARDGTQVGAQDGTQVGAQDGAQVGARGGTQDAAPAGIFDFDPNTVTLQELCRLGFSQRTAAGIIKFRTRGKRFEIPEDFASCYGVTLEQYTRLEPHIRIDEQYRPAPRREPAGGIPRADAHPAPRETSSVRSHASHEPERRIPKPPVELNTADSLLLRSVAGIGEKLVVRIMDYRTRLGGYVSVGQLLEIPGMYEDNYKRICEQIIVDSCVIQKIDINFAPHENLVAMLGRHPYISAAGIRKLLKNRQLKGGWRSIEDMESENIVTPSQARKLAPYLIFNTTM